MKNWEEMDIQIQIIINNVFTSSEENVNVHPHAKLTSTIGKVVAYLWLLGSCFLAESHKRSPL